MTASRDGREPSPPACSIRFPAAEPHQMPLQSRARGGKVRTEMRSRQVTHTFFLALFPRWRSTDLGRPLSGAALACRGRCGRRLTLSSPSNAVCLGFCVHGALQPQNTRFQDSLSRVFFVELLVALPMRGSKSRMTYLATLGVCS